MVLWHSGVAVLSVTSPDATSVPRLLYRLHQLPPHCGMLMGMVPHLLIPLLWQAMTDQRAMVNQQDMAHNRATINQATANLLCCTRQLPL